MKNSTRTVTRLMLTFALLLGIFAASQSASAAPIVHAVQQSVSVAAGASGSVTVSCPVGNLLMGGGWQGDSPMLVIMDNTPLSSGGWFARAINTDASAHSLAVYALCTSAAGSFTIVAGNWMPALQGQQATSVATCSSGILTGGGFRVSGGAIKESYPHAAQWASTVTNNTNNASVSVISLGVCLSAAVNVSVVSQVSNITGISSATATCAAGKVLTGGGFQASNRLITFASFPLPSTSGIPSTWLVRAQGNLTQPLPMTVYALCAN